MSDPKAYKICKRCKKNKTVDNYRLYNNVVNKTCDSCNDKCIQSKKKRKEKDKKKRTAIYDMRKINNQLRDCNYISLEDDDDDLFMSPHDSLSTEVNNRRMPKHELKPLNLSPKNHKLDVVLHMLKYLMS